MLAGRLERLNEERQSLDQRFLEEALAQVEAAGPLDRRAGIVFCSDDWHPGVVGDRGVLQEWFGRPTFLVCFDGDIGKDRAGASPARPARRPHRVRRSAGALWGAPHGGRHPPAENFSAFKERFERVAGERLGPLTPAPSSAWTWRSR